MKLSIVIVNFNVKYILEQCLHSVYSAIENVQAEVFVVDNNSVDGSVAMIQEKFPWVKLIANKDNVGFSKANNQAIRNSQGEYVLLLNPDTLVEQNTFTSVIDFMDLHKDAGGLGVKMIDGKGKYLPESKRGLPTLKVSITKMLSLHKLFPKSKRFNYYYMGHLDENSINEIEILSGAFMFMRKSVLNEIGLLDEEYFMYGEDIDLSYRITKAGYKNYYFPETTIIHYKGESTKRASFKYVLVFYKAMEIFARKQLNVKKYSLHSLFINTAIWLRAFIAMFSRVFTKVFMPILDASVIMLAFYFIGKIWAPFHFKHSTQYPLEFFLFIAPAFTLIYLTAIYFSAGYERPVKLGNLLRGIGAGFIGVLVLYSLFPEGLRFSRALIFLTFISISILFPLIRFLFSITKFKKMGLLVNKDKKIILVGDEQETERVKSFLNQTDVHVNIVGCVSLQNDVKSSKYLGSINQLQEIVNQHSVNEIIFCLKDVGASRIIENMLSFSTLQVDFKIAPPDSLSVIGSNSSNTAGDLYIIELNSIAKGRNRKKKRIFDIASSFLLLVTSIFWIFFCNQKGRKLQAIFQVLIGKKTWIAYANKDVLNEEFISNLPAIKSGILFPGAHFSNLKNADFIKQAHIAYVKDYKVRNDIILLWKNFGDC